MIGSAEGQLLHCNLLRKVASVLALLTLSCGGKSAGSGTSTTIAPADFPLAFAHTVCGSVSSCCTQSAFGFDEATCIANATQLIQRELPPNNGSLVSTQSRPRAA